MRRDITELPFDMGKYALTEAKRQKYAQKAAQNAQKAAQKIHEITGKVEGFQQNDISEGFIPPPHTLAPLGDAPYTSHSG